LNLELNKEGNYQSRDSGFMKSKSVISYADTTIGAVFFNISPSHNRVVQEDIIPIALRRKESAEARLDYVRRLAWYTDTYHRSLRNHEWCHILQAVIYPALYFRCVRELNLVESILTTYRHDNEPQIPIRRWLPEEWQKTLMAPTRLYQMNINQSGDLHILPGNPIERGRSDLTENDLLEEDASIFQYKVEIGRQGNGFAYRKWLREQSRYTMTFNFLARLVGEENAYLALPPLVQTSFCTTTPMETFGQLVSLTVRTNTDLPSKLGIDDYLAFLQTTIRTSTLGLSIPNPEKPITEDPLSRLDSEAMYEFIQASANHPLQPLAQDLWLNQSEKQFQEYMLHPYRAFNRYTGEVSEELMKFWPPMMVLRLLDPALSLKDAVFVVAPQFAGKPWKPLPEITYDEYFSELLNRRYLAFALVTDLYDNVPHNCHLTECPYHKTNLCRRWLFIPPEPELCDFPKVMEISTFHYLDIDENVLRPRA
jgi:hypothetical protein